MKKLSVIRFKPLSKSRKVSLRSMLRREIGLKTKRSMSFKMKKRRFTNSKNRPLWKQANLLRNVKKKRKTERLEILRTKRQLRLSKPRSRRSWI